MSPDVFAGAVLQWFDGHGRKALPWQRNPTPYRVWVSEIMLQQTQVSTVIGYFERFVTRFPEVRSLADGELDEVLHLWSGLGYYARARHLHAAARTIRDHHGGRFPDSLEALCALPGVGRSTAGAVLALSRGRRHPILDGNVKRVLARLHAVEGWSGRSAGLARLWELAEHYTPRERVADYTQAMMDLGATVCTRGRPACERCPLANHCEARRQDRVAAFPVPRPRRDLPVRATRMLLARNADGHVLLQRRPPTGLWGGLWSFPEPDAEVDIAEWCRRRLGLEIDPVETWPVLRHSFSHFHLDITPVLVRVQNPALCVLETAEGVWYNTRVPDARGLAAPVQRLLETLNNKR